MTKAGIVVIFDFDKTVIDVDSDNWVVDELGLTELFNELLPTMPWNSLMDTMMSEIHARGNTAEDIATVLQRVPVHAGTLAAVKSAHALGCELRIVSDANTFFIETILDHLGLRGCFSEINTNPGHVDEEGRLRILPFHDFNKCHHGCALCPPNMCKGLIIERIRSDWEGEKTMIYVGDGSGDYCPSLRLKERDFVMPRRGFPLRDLIGRNPSMMKAEIHEWVDGDEQELLLLRIIHSLLVTSSIMLSSDCKLLLASLDSSHGTFPNVVPVPPQFYPFH